MSQQPQRPHEDEHAPQFNPPTRKLADWKQGSESDQAGKVGSKGDFGVHASKSTQADRDYTNRNTKVSDPGTASPWSHEHDGSRQSGAGGRDSGPGSASGGDIDPDIVGVGFGGDGLSQSGPGEPADPPELKGRRSASKSNRGDGGDKSDEEPAEKAVQASGLERSTSADERGADAANSGHASPGYGDAFSGEISSDEAAGGDSVRS